MAGVRHLKAVENEMSNNPGKAYSRTELRDSLKIDYRAILDILEYLLGAGKVKQVPSEGKPDKYQWVK